MKAKRVEIIIVLLMSFLCMNLEAQTVIREKVKINTSKLADRINFSQLENINWWPCSPPPKSTDYYNPHQVVWQGAKFPLNPGRQDLRSVYSYSIDKNKIYTIRVLTGNEHCYIQRNKWSPDYGEPEKIFDVITLSGSDMLPKTMTDTGLVTIHDSIKYVDRDGAPFYVLEYFYEYTLHFGYIDQSEAEIVYAIEESGGSTIYVHTYIKKPNYDMIYSADKDTILYREKNKISIGANAVECYDSNTIMVPRNGGGLADDVNCIFRITKGAEYATLNCADSFISGDEISIPYSTAISGITIVTKDDINPAQDEEIIIECTCSDSFVRNNVSYINFIMKHNPFPPPSILFVFNKNNIAKGDSTNFALKQRTVDGQIIEFATDQKFNISVYDGSDYGSLYNIEYDMYNNSMEDVPNGFKFYSYPDIEPTSVTVIFRATTLISSSSSSVIANKNKEMMIPAGLNMLFIGGGEEQLEGYGELTIGEPAEVDTFYVKADFEKETLVVGDTVRVLVKKVDKFGNESSFPAGTLFEASVMEGCTTGELMKGNLKGTFLNNLTEPFYFVVSDSLTTADTLVTIKVGVQQEDVVTYLSYDDFYGKTNGGLSLSIVNNGVAGKATKHAKVTSACSTHEITLPSDRATGHINQIEIISPQKDTTFYITMEPKTPEITCSARLLNNTNGEVKFIWEFGIYYTLKRKNKNGPICGRTGGIIFKDSTYSYNTEITSWPVQFKKNKISYVKLKGRNYKTGCDEIISSWDESDDVWIGDSVYISVTAFVGKTRVGFNDLKTVRILGKNPSPQQIKNYQSDKKIWAIIEHESSWLQFDINKTQHRPYNVIGLPRYGYPSGYGLMQIDNYGTEENPQFAAEMELWNWKRNIDRGVGIFTIKLNDAVEYLNEFDQEYADSVLTREAYFSYNGNGGRRFWKWDKEEKAWIRNDWLIIGYDDNKKAIYKENYPDTVYNIYKTF